MLEMKAPISRPNLSQDPKLNRKYIKFEQLIVELKKQEIPDETVSSINDIIETVNGVTGSDKELNKQLRRAQSSLISLLEKQLKIVVKNHYRNIWLALGIAIGTSIGAVIGPITGNMAFIGIGLPFGLAIGIAIGTQMDKKAKEEGRQLDIELNY